MDDLPNKIPATEPGRRLCSSDYNAGEIATHAQVCRDLARGNLDDADYAAFRQRVAARFALQTEWSRPCTTDADAWTAYIEAFPAGPVRQHHNCRACEQFLRHYGGLAVITPAGELVSAMWDEADADPVHRDAVVAMARAVRRATVTGVFLTRETNLGRAVTSTWNHLAMPTPARALHTNKAVELGAAIGEKTQAYATVARALGEYDITIIRQAVNLLKSDALYRSEKVLAPAQWLLDLAEAARPGYGVRSVSNLIWRAVAKAPPGFCHPRSSMIGTLLDDLASGIGFGEASRRFREKMAPDTYQRPQAAPTAGAIKAAEDLVAKLGIASSLRRRFARLEEVESLWRPPAAPAAPESGGVFGHVPVKGRYAAALVGGDAGRQTVTWARFARLALPDARSIQAHVPLSGNFCALVTAEDPAAPPILQWDREDRRNPVSWYLYMSASHATRWCLTACEWVPVDAVALLPWAWSAPEMTHHAAGAIFIIHGARDLSHEGGALFPEILRSELHGARSVIEAYSRTAKLGGAAEASACGLMIGGSRGVVVRVTSTAGVSTTYTIDRWD